MAGNPAKNPVQVCVRGSSVSHHAEAGHLGEEQLDGSKRGAGGRLPGVCLRLRNEPQGLIWGWIGPQEFREHAELLSRSRGTVERCHWPSPSGG